MAQIGERVQYNLKQQGVKINASPTEEVIYDESFKRLTIEEWYNDLYRLITHMYNDTLDYEPYESLYETY